MKFFFSIFFISLLWGINIPFQVGETLNYKATFSGIDAATGRLQVLGKETINDVSTYHVRFQANSHGITNLLFPIQDEIDFWLDDKSLFPVRVKKNINEGNYHKKSVLDLLQDQGMAIIKKDTIPIATGTQSPYSLFYYFRNKDLTGMGSHTFQTMDGRKKTNLILSVVENLNVSVPAGDFLCTKITPMRIDQKKFKNEATMSIWFSNDEHRYPVQIWLKMKFGAFVLKLDEIIN
jgi:hypothetical protein